MSNLHHVIYQSYLQLMHDFCQYPRLTELLRAEGLSPRAHVLGIGKAAWKMASLCAGILRQRGIGHDGYVLTKYGHSHGELPSLSILEAAHPIPDPSAINASRVVVDWLKGLPKEEDLIILLSGGSSALFEMLPGSVSLQEFTDITSQLLKSGKDIAAINRRRKEISLLKGGKALALTPSRRVYVYAVSDVGGNDPRVIGSGPFTPPEGGARENDSWHYEMSGKDIRYRVVADNHLFCRQFTESLAKQGLDASFDGQFQACPVARFSAQLKELLRRAHHPRFRLKPPFIRVFGGELTLEVKGGGKGGRCSHLALSMTNPLSKFENAALFCFATDGSDNIAGSGGACVDSHTRSELRQAGIDVTRSKRDHDSYTALKAIHKIIPSPVLATNVNDVFVLSVGYDLENPVNCNSLDEPDLFAGML
ncbi:MAG: DUF4147 domain-containing protein [Candidatus Syntrophosphaera sp.]